MKVFRVLIVFLCSTAAVYLFSILHIKAGAETADLTQFKEFQSPDVLPPSKPENLHKAIEWLDSVLSEQFKEQLIVYSQIDESDLSYDGYLASTPYGHNGLGMSIRNGFGLWADSQLKRWFLWRGIFHPDDMSEILLKQYVLHLNGLPTNNYGGSRLGVLAVLSAFITGLLVSATWVVCFIRRKRNRPLVDSGLGH